MENPNLSCFANPTPSLGRDPWDGKIPSQNPRRTILLLPLPLAAIPERWERKEKAPNFRMRKLGSSKELEMFTWTGAKLPFIFLWGLGKPHLDKLLIPNPTFSSSFFSPLLCFLQFLGMTGETFPCFHPAFLRGSALQQHKKSLKFQFFPWGKVPKFL